MSAICRITICAYVFGDIPMGLENGYTRDDLVNGIDYCEGLMEDYGMTKEPHDGFSLPGYTEWARGLLAELSPKEAQNEQHHSTPKGIAKNCRVKNTSLAQKSTTDN